MTPRQDAIKILTKRRKALSLSVSTISRLLRIPENTLRRWESGESNPSIYYQNEIKKLLSVIEELQKEMKGPRIILSPKKVIDNLREDRDAHFRKRFGSSGLEMEARLKREAIEDSVALKRELIQAVDEVRELKAKLEEKNG